MLDLQLPMQSVYITTEDVSYNLTHGDVSSIPFYIKACHGSDLRQVDGFLCALWFPPPNKTDCHDITDILLKRAFRTTTLTL